MGDNAPTNILPSKVEIGLFSRLHHPPTPSFTFCDQVVESQSSYKYLGIFFDQRLTFRKPSRIFKWVSCILNLKSKVQICTMWVTRSNVIILAIFLTSRSPQNWPIKTTILLILLSHAPLSTGKSLFINDNFKPFFTDYHVFALFVETAKSRQNEKISVFEFGSKSIHSSNIRERV